ncbi:MAG: hypothetical protein II423_07760, partial [Erysipelotrichaceae bacterium]|nr:hypothetical protein [Erysipelotrichaceae bacterium]
MPSGNYSVSLLRDFEDDFRSGYYKYKEFANQQKAKKIMTTYFLRSFFSEEVVDFLMNEYEYMIYKLVDAWKPEEIANKDNIFVHVLQNEKFLPILKQHSSGVEDVYSAYVNRVFDELDYTDDGDSIIYDPDLYRYYEDDYFAEMVGYDFSLREDKERRKEIMYDNEGR